MGLFSSIGNAVGSVFGSVGDAVGGTSSSDPSKVFGAQVPFLQDIFQQSSQERFDQSGTNFANQFQNPALQGFQNLSQGGVQTDLSGLNQLAQGGQFSGFQGQQNDALGGAINAGLRQINQNFNEQILPGINTGAAVTGTSGGSRQGIAQGIAARGANDTAADFVNKLQSNNFNQIQGRNLQAQQSGVQSQLGAFQGLSDFAGQQNAATASGLQTAPALQNLGFNTQFGNLNQRAELIGRPTVLGGGSQSSGGFGGALTGAAALLPLLSDERVKENIKKVGKLDNGLPVYSYNYIGSPQTQIGLLAQQVEIKNPDAVVEYGGLKHVYYDKAVV